MATNPLCQSALEDSLHIIKFELGHGGRIRKGLFNLSQSRHVLLGLPLVTAGLCQFPLSSPLRESISQAWMNKSSGDSTEVRTPIATLKGWPPSQLEDGTIKQDSTFACLVAVLSTDTAGREDFPRPSQGGPGSFDQPISTRRIARGVEIKLNFSLSTAPYLHYSRNSKRFEVLLYSS